MSQKPPRRANSAELDPALATLTRALKAAGQHADPDPNAASSQKRGLVSELARAFPEVQGAKKRAVLGAVAAVGSVERACRMVGVSISLPWKAPWRLDPAWQAGLTRAKQMYVDTVLEPEIDRRAVEGTLEPVGWHKGKPGGVIRRFSDNLLMFRTKALAPQYQDRTTVGGAILHGHIDLRTQPNEVIARIAQGEDPSAVILSMASGALEAQQAAKAKLEAAELAQLADGEAGSAGGEA